MDSWQLLRGLFFDYTLRTVALGSATLGIVSGALGSYAVLRKQSLLGDAISHAVLPPHKIPYMIRIPAGPLWRARLGEPSRDHRGWEQGIFDVYDIAVVAKLANAGPGGISRERFVLDVLPSRPWGGL